ncbi:MAG: adenylate/guanylate cyclase domain-containing protein [Pseudomonadota bacterium]
MASATGLSDTLAKHYPGLSTLSDTLLRDGLVGQSFEELLATFSTSLNAAGFDIMRIHVTMRTNHPEFGSLAHRWLRDEGTHQENFTRSDTPQDDWLQSPLHYLLRMDADELRQRLDEPAPRFDFPFFDELRAQGATDYIVFKRFFDRRDGSLAIEGDALPEGCLLSIATDALCGYSDRDLAVIRSLLSPLLLALKSFGNKKAAEDIATTYLGPDAGRRVLSGEILRGSVDHVEAVIFYFDLAGFTQLSEALAGVDIIEMLNDYFGLAVDIVTEHGGNVLKFMGDGMLAIFDVTAMEDANKNAIAATLSLRAAMADTSARREAAGLAVTGFTLALHRGEVLYGNIGGRSRLDFTVIGPAVNTTARLSGMCAHVDQSIVISAPVARPLLHHCAALVSLGTYRLRGVASRQELFTLD